LQQILVTWNATDADYPRELPIQGVFEQQVERTPDAIALVGENASLSYFELNEKANQLARFPQELRRQARRSGGGVAAPFA
jgi:non-ribosomal peptide synthetase component F